MTQPLRRRAFAAVRWSALAVVGQSGLQLLQVAIVARILPAADFGLIAVVWALLAFAGMIAGLGTGTAVIQARSIAPEALSSLYWLNVLVGVALALAFGAASPLIAIWYGEPRLQALLAWTGLSFALAAVGQPLRTMAQKELHFREIAWIELAASAGGFCVTVAGALGGFGVFSLVAGVLVARLLGSLLDWALLAKGWRPELRLRIDEVRPFLSFGAYTIGSNLANTVHAQADILLGGRYLPAAVLGEYSLARNLCIQVYSVINPILTRVATPVLAVAQDDRDRLRYIYLSLVRLTTSINFPVYLALAAFADEVVAIIYGPRWTAAAEFMRILALWGLLRSIGNPAGSLSLAAGRPDLAFKWELAMLVFIPSLLLVGLQEGAQGLALAMLTVSVALIVPAWYFLGRRLCSASFADYLRQFAVPLAIALVAAGAARLASAPFISDPARLAAGLATGLFVYSAISLQFNRPLAAAVGELLSLGGRR